MKCWDVLRHRTGICERVWFCSEQIYVASQDEATRLPYYPPISWSQCNVSYRTQSTLNPKSAEARVGVSNTSFVKTACPEVGEGQESFGSREWETVFHKLNVHMWWRMRVNVGARRGVCGRDALHQHVVVQGLGLRLGGYNNNTLDYSTSPGFPLGVFAMEVMIQYHEGLMRILLTQVGSRTLHGL